MGMSADYRSGGDARRDRGPGRDRVVRGLGQVAALACAWSRDSRRCAGWRGMWCATRSTTAIPAASSPATLAGLLVSSRTSSMPSARSIAAAWRIIALVVGKAEPRGWRRPCRARGPAAHRRAACWRGRCRALPGADRAAPRRPPSPISRSASLELRPAIAFQRAEHVAGQAFAVQPDQRRLAAERADQQRDMLLRRRPERGRRRSGVLGKSSSGSCARATQVDARRASVA